ncbi:cuticle protein 19-like, partial [Procambarus clarkii]|uniref:cuticle protein 19-like n=1 Tax=Procambarus clarkii TaxID=6728 RepID=UPI001E673CA9
PPPPPTYGPPPPPPPPTYGTPAPPPPYGALVPAPPKYDFTWAVKDQYSGNDFGHQESRDGYNTQGSYYVLLPDGRLQKVTYTVHGDSGYVAVVTYEGEAKIPTPKPVYGAPAPVYA